MRPSEPTRRDEPAGTASSDVTTQGEPGWHVVQRQGQPGAAGKGNAAARRYAGVTPASKSAGQTPGTTAAKTPQSKPPQAPTDDTAAAPADALTRPADAIIVVIASRGGKELGRWEGPMDYFFELPARFTATRTGAGWTWNDDLGAGINIQSQDRHKGGISVTKWARRLGAREIEIVLIPHPGSPEPDAGKDGYGTHGQGQGGDRPEGKTSDGHGAESALGAGTRAQDGAADIAPLEDLVTAGMGKQGLGTEASGASGREDAQGQGATGRSAGHEEGSEDPSWNEAEGAAIDNEQGGRTPTEHGQLGGSAGGEQGGKGHLLGSGWLDVIDAPEEIAAAINVGIILADANINNLGKGLFEKAIRRIARETLEQEIERTVKTAVRSAMRAQKRQLRRIKSFRALSKTEQTRILKDFEKQAELELYERLQKYARSRADEYERAAANVADKSDEQSKRSRELAQENAAAYREIEDACAQKTGSSANARTSGTADDARGSLDNVSTTGGSGVTLEGVADATHEAAQATRFAQMEGGGRFRFLGNSSQGIEGFYTRSGTQLEIPVSLKDFSSTGNLRNIIGRINRNAAQVSGAGYAGRTVLHASVRQATVEQMMTFIQDGPLGRMASEGVFSRLVFECSDGVVEATASGLVRR